MTEGKECACLKEEDKRFVDEVIRKDLVLGVIKAKSKGTLIRIIDELASLRVKELSWVAQKSHCLSNRMIVRLNFSTLP